MNVFGRVLPLRYLIIIARPRLRRLLVFLLLLLAVLFCAFAVYLGVRYAVTTADNERMIAAMANQLVPPLAYVRSGPQPIVIESTALVAAGQGTFDVLATAKNPSRHWALLRATYTIALEGVVLGTGTVNFLPLETRTLTLFSVRPQRVSPHAQLEVTFSDYEWRNVKREPRLALVDVRVTQAALLTFEPVAGKKITRVTGVLENRSVVNFTELPVLVLVRRGATPLGIGRVILSNVEAGGTRSIDFRFPTFLDGSRATLEAAVPLDMVLE